MNVKKNKFLTDMVVFIFTLVKVIVFSSTANLGFSLNSEMQMEAHNVAFLISALFYSVAVTVLIHCVLKAQGDKSNGICIFLLADPLSFFVQKSTGSMLIVGFAMFFAATVIKNKTALNKTVALVLTLAVMMTLAPETFFGFVPAAVMLYVLSEKRPVNKNTVKALSASSAVAILAGLCINAFVIRGSESVKTAVDRFIGLNDAISNVYYVFIIPAVALGFVLFSLIMMSVDVGKNKDKSPEIVKISKSVRAIVLISIVSTFFFSKVNLYTVSFLLPTAVVVLLCNENPYAVKTIEKTNRFIDENKGVFLVGLILTVYVFSHLLLRYANTGCLVSEFIFG